MKGFAPGLVLKQEATRKWPIQDENAHFRRLFKWLGTNNPFV